MGDCVTVITQCDNTLCMRVIVINTDFGPESADVACRQLGYQQGSHIQTLVRTEQCMHTAHEPSWRSLTHLQHTIVCMYVCIYDYIVGHFQLHVASFSVEDLTFRLSCNFYRLSSSIPLARILSGLLDPRSLACKPLRSVAMGSLKHPND